jgi:hypothetical protein
MLLILWQIWSSLSFFVVWTEIQPKDFSGTLIFPGSPSSETWVHEEAAGYYVFYAFHPRGLAGGSC